MEDKKLHSNDLIVSLGSEDFRQYFRDNILPHLEPIERHRVELRAELDKKRKRTTCIAAFVLIIFATLFYGPFFIVSLFTRLSVFPIIYALFMGGILLAMIWVAEGRWNKTKFKELTNKKVIPMLFSYWGTFKYCDQPTYTIGEAFTLFAKLKIYPKLDSIDIDDCIEGHYNGLDLKITELDVTYAAQNNKNNNTAYVFDGLMLEVDMNKNFTSHTIIKASVSRNSPNYTANTGLGKQFQKVDLEDPEFKKKFDVYSTDQIESRYLLTTAFIQRLLDLKNAVGSRVEVVFLDRKAYIFIDYYEDKFELPSHESVLEMKHYQKILLDLARMLRVVDTLKLEQDTGL